MEFNLYLKQDGEFDTLFKVREISPNKFDKPSGIKRRFDVVSHPNDNTIGTFLIYNEGNGSIIIGAGRENFMQSMYELKPFVR